MIKVALVSAFKKDAVMLENRDNMELAVGHPFAE
jgi:hypothetical protein